jgi:hypothetical protein
VGRDQRWRLTALSGTEPPRPAPPPDEAPAVRGERLVAEHSFDRIYVSFDAELYPSPDGRQAVLVMHLDSGWEIDAAIYPVPLAAAVPHARVDGAR